GQVDTSVKVVTPGHNRFLLRGLAAFPVGLDLILCSCLRKRSHKRPWAGRRMRMTRHRRNRLTWSWRGTHTMTSPASLAKPRAHTRLAAAMLVLAGLSGAPAHAQGTLEAHYTISASTLWFLRLSVGQ